MTIIMGFIYIVLWFGSTTFFKKRLYPSCLTNINLPMYMFKFGFVFCLFFKKWEMEYKFFSTCRSENYLILIILDDNLVIKKYIYFKWFFLQLQRYLLEKAMATHSSTLAHGGRSLVGCSPWGGYQSDMTEWLHFHFSLSRIGEGNGNPLQCSCLENPRDGGVWWAAICGVTELDMTEVT